MNINGAFSGNNDSDIDSPSTAHPDGLKAESPSYGLAGGLTALHKLRRTSTNGSPKPLTLSSSRESMIRVTDLKRALSGYGSGSRHASPLRIPMSGTPSQHSEDSDSLMSYHDAEGANGSNLDLSVVDSNVQEASPSSTHDTEQRPQSSARINTSTTVYDVGSRPADNADPRLGSDVPPVPKIPSSLNLPGTYPRDPSPIRPTTPRREHYRPQTAPQGLQKTKLNGLPSSTSLREGRSLRRGNSKSVNHKEHSSADPAHGGASRGVVDLGKLLASINSGTDSQAPEEKESADITLKPPY